MTSSQVQPTSKTALKHTISLKTSGELAKVTDNPINKIKYYLKTVTGLIQLKQDQYHQCDITQHGISCLLEMCTKFRPENFMNRCLFIQPELCGHFSNQFYEVYQVMSILDVSKPMRIQGKIRNINKVMVCKKEWLMTNYMNPLKFLSNYVIEPESRQKLLKLLPHEHHNPEGCSIM